MFLLKALSSTQVSQQRLSHIPRFPAVAAAARLPISSTEGVAASRLAGPAAATGLASTAAGPRHTSNNAAGLRTASQTGSPPLSSKSPIEFIWGGGHGHACVCGGGGGVEHDMLGLLILWSGWEVMEIALPDEFVCIIIIVVVCSFHT